MVSVSPSLATVPPFGPIACRAIFTCALDCSVFESVGVRARRPPFDDPQVRNAMGLAFNREAYLEKIFHGLGEPVNSHVFYRHPHFKHSVEWLLAVFSQAHRYRFRRTCARAQAASQAFVSVHHDDTVCIPFADGIRRAGQDAGRFSAMVTGSRKMAHENAREFPFFVI